MDIYVDGGSTSNLLYFTFKREGTTATCDIYSDSGRTTLVDSLSITCETGTKQYLYAINVWGETGQTTTITGYVQNLAEITQVPGS